MRYLFLASTATVLLCGGLALAKPGDTTTITVPVVKNAAALGGSSAATSGGTSTNTNKSNNTVDSNNPSTDKNSSAAFGSASATSGGTANATDTLVSVGSVSLSSVRSNYHLDVDATASNDGEVSDVVVNANGGGKKGGGDAFVSSDATITGSVNGDAGITTAQQNSGTGSLQQNSVALSSNVQGGTGFNGFNP